MSLLEAFGNLFEKEREHLFAGWIDPARTDKQPTPEPLQAGRHYVRLWLAEMFLRDEVKWMQTLHPVVHSVARFDFGDHPVEIPNIADLARAGAQGGERGAVVARNFQLTPTMPFNGGTLSLEAGLLALPGQNYLKGFLDVLGKFAGLLNVPQLSAALGIAQPLALGVQQLLGPAAGGSPHLGFRDSFTAGVRGGYLAAVRAPEKELPKLYVVNDQLRTGQGLGPGQHRPLEGFDYMLFRLEVFTERDDWEQLGSIQESFQEAIRDLSDPLTEERAVFNLRRAMLRARLAPELTTADRRRVVEALRERFEEARADFGKSGLTGGGPLTLAQAMTYARDPESALLDGVPTVNEIFSRTAGGGRRAAAMEPEEPWVVGSGSESVGGGGDGSESTAGEEQPGPPPQSSRPPAAEGEAHGFSFALEGDDVRHGVARCGTEFDFVFEYAAPRQDHTALAILAEAEALDEARRTDATLSLSVIPRGFTFPDGVWTKTFKFSGGEFAEPVRFRLKADREPVEESGLYLLFERDGCVLYEFPVSVKLVRTGEEVQGAPARAPLALDLEELMEEAEYEPRKVKVVITASADRLSILYANEGTDETFELHPNFISRASLAGLLMKTRATLGELAAHPVWDLMADPFKPPADAGVARGLERCLRLAVEAGAALHSELSFDPEFAKLLKKLNELPTGTLLSIRTDCAYLPWELIYPAKFRADGNALPQEQQLWGNRFSIECLQTGMGKEYRTPTRKHQAGPARFSFNLNTTIDAAFAGKNFLPVASHNAFGQELSALGVAVEVFDEAGEMRKLLRTEDCASTLLYFYCHGQNDKPLADDHAEKLELAEGEYLVPEDLDDEVIYPRGPLVFLNSCSSGGFSPLSFGTFLTRFRDKQALGLVATSFTIPATFAAVFGQRLLRRYVAGEPLGRALLDLRRELLKLRVPLGLFYSLYCPADISIRKKGANDG